MNYSDYGISIPNGKIHGEVDCVCPKCSHDRKKANLRPLRVNLDKMTWFCHHCQFTGGLPKQGSYTAVPKIYTKPVWKNNTDLSDKLIKYCESRKISQNTLVKMKVTEEMVFLPQPAKEVNCIVFNYFRDSELVNYKARDGAKNFGSFKGAELIFYNLDSLHGAKEVYITEGEWDALALIESGLMLQEGVAVLSVPNGANPNSNNLQYVDNCIDLFDHVEKIHIATDNDAPGRKLREDLADRFGKDRCDYIEFGGEKDANDLLIKKGIQAVIEACGDKKEFPLEGIFRVSDYTHDIEDMYQHGIDHGTKAGMGKFDDHLRFVKGWFTMVGGIPNSGKTAFLDNLLVKLMVNHGWKNAYYSPENKPTKLHFSKLARILIGKNWFGKNRISRAELQAAMEFFEDKVYFVEPERNFNLDTILDGVKLLKKRKGIDCFTIDAWNRVEQKYEGKNETKHINESLLKLDAFCKLHNLHCFLVAHPTKMDKDKRTGKFLVPNLYSISGSSHFFNISGNGFTAYRNFDTGTTDIHIQKVKFQPEWGSQGIVTYRYDPENGRFNEAERRDNEGKLDPNFRFTEDKSNWLLAEQKQAVMDIPESSGNDIISGKHDEMPF